MAQSKIEKWGLQKRIDELIEAGTHTSAALSAALKLEHFDVSQPTLSRYLKALRESRLEETQKIVQDHIKKTVPADLDALQSMEGQCLDWAKEDNPAFSHRIAGLHIEENFTQWQTKILGITPAAYLEPSEFIKAKMDAVRDIMQQCLLWIADDIAMQKKRIGAMRQATQIIALKLQYSGIIGADQNGNIFLVRQGDELKEETNTGRLLVLRGGKPDASK